jgi:hypothetical protein
MTTPEEYWRAAEKAGPRSKGAKASPSLATLAKRAQKAANGGRIVLTFDEGEMHSTRPRWHALAYRAREDAKHAAMAALHAEAEKAGGSVALARFQEEWDRWHERRSLAYGGGLTVEEALASLASALAGCEPRKP